MPSESFCGGGEGWGVGGSLGGSFFVVARSIKVERNWKSFPLNIPETIPARAVLYGLKGISIPKLVIKKKPEPLLTTNREIKPTAAPRIRDVSLTVDSLDLIAETPEPIIPQETSKIPNKASLEKKSKNTIDTNESNIDDQ